jgi:diguanylate cyclase
MGKNTLDSNFPWLETLRETEKLSPDKLSHSYEVLKKLLPFMAKRGIPLTPKNYRLFYDYIVFANPEINKTLNEFLDKDVTFTDQISSNLYALFYAEEGAALALQVHSLNKAAKTFIKVSDNMSESLRSARVQHDHFHEVLTNTSRQMADIAPEGEGEIQTFLKDLLSETEQTLTATDALSSRLNEANEVITSLKVDLKTQTELAKIDELTQLSNRRHLNQEGPPLVLEARETGRPVSAIIFDIDLFKNVNDAWGHANGDKVLTICAGIIKNAARRTDLAVRLGGEEFLLLCSNLDLPTAARVAERVRQSIASTKIDLKTRSIGVTVSGGVATYIRGEELYALIARADAALYQAKTGGRDRICLAETIPLGGAEVQADAPVKDELQEPDKSYEEDELDR